MLSVMPQAIPLELLAITPPMVQAISLAGSGPSFLPKRASRAFTARTVAPGSTRTWAPSFKTSIFRKFRRVSIKRASLTACPERLVPPLLKVTLVFDSLANLKSCAISEALIGVATPVGIKWKWEASDEIR